MVFQSAFPSARGWVKTLPGILPFPPSCRFPKAGIGAAGCFPSHCPAGTWGKLQLLTQNQHGWGERNWGTHGPKTPLRGPGAQLLTQNQDRFWEWGDTRP